MPLLQSGDLDSTDVTQHFHCCWVALRQSQQHLLCMTIRQWHMRHAHSHTLVHTHIVIVSPGKHLRKGSDFRLFFQVASVTFVLYNTPYYCDFLCCYYLFAHQHYVREEISLYWQPHASTFAFHMFIGHVDAVQLPSFHHHQLFLHLPQSDLQHLT